MSDRLSLRDYNLQKDHWIGLYGPMSMRALESLQEEWDEDFKRIRYMTFSRYQNSGEFGMLNSIKGFVTFQASALDGVKVDIEQIWNTRFVRTNRGIHTFVENPLGFEFRAMNVNGAGEYFQGRIVVIARPRE